LKPGGNGARLVRAGGLTAILSNAGERGALSAIIKSHLDARLHSDDSAGMPTPAGRIPVLYCTDLFHPHDDPDDHFDLATLYAIPEFDLRGIVLDQGG
jgi:hypothetical protein